MLRETVAEWILRAATNRESAAAIVGDLVQSQTPFTKFWFAVGSVVAHGINRRVIGHALAAFVLQFILPFPAIAVVTTYYFSRSTVTIHAFQVLHYYNLANVFATQVLVGWWIARQKQNRSALVCLLLIIIDCGLGLLKVNSVSVNMAAWSVPVLLGTVLARKAHVMRRPMSVP